MDITTSKRVRAEGDTKPDRLFDKHVNGSWSYNFDPIQVEREETMHEMAEDETTTTRKVWQWFIIDVGGILTKDNVKKIVMDYLWGVDYENKLMNKYNAYKMKITTDKSAETEYNTFLQERISVMDKINADFENI